jgi:hypothetical protein
VKWAVRSFAFCVLMTLGGCSGPLGSADDLSLMKDVTSSTGAYRLTSTELVRTESSGTTKVVDCRGTVRGVRASVVSGHSLVVAVCATDQDALVSFVVDDVLEESVEYCELRRSLPAGAAAWWRDRAEVFSNVPFQFCN